MGKPRRLLFDSSSVSRERVDGVRDTKTAGDGRSGSYVQVTADNIGYKVRVFLPRKGFILLSTQVGGA